LGFILKPNSYGKRDWGWFLEKIEGRIFQWCNPTRGGKVTSIKSIPKVVYGY
jgi:hypothetical protein